MKHHLHDIAGHRGVVALMFLIAGVGFLVGSTPARADEAAASAVLVVKLPAGATLTIGGKPTQQTSAERTFETPPLTPGKTYYYELKATWTEGGRSRTVTRNAVVRAGRRTVIDLTAPEPPPQPGAGTGGTKPEPPVAPTGKPVGKFPGPLGMLIRRPAPGAAWSLVPKDAEVHSGELLLGLHNATVQSLNGAVSVRWFADLDNRSPFPIIETAIIVHEPKGVDFDFTLDRGRVILTNTKPAGAARVRVGIRNKSAEVVLNEKDASVAIEIYGRWLPGVPFQKKPSPDYAPSLDLAVLVLKGSIDIRSEGKQMAMHAPPGPALFQWDSDTGGDPTPRFLKEVPDWGMESSSAEAQKRRAIGEELRRIATEQSMAAAVDAFVNSDDPMKRRLAIFAMAALDDMERLAAALVDPKHRDVWDNAVMALRHWIGRGPGQDHKLYEGLMKMRGYKEVDAAAVLQMLHGFSEEQIRTPELYETLIDYLGHSKLAIRGLAHWHLVRLARAGKKIDYNPLGSEEERKKAIDQWRALIPAGTLPKPEQPKP